MTAKAFDLKRKLLVRCGVPGEYIDLDRSASFLSEIRSNQHKNGKNPTRTSMEIGDDLRVAMIKEAQRDHEFASQGGSKTKSMDEDRSFRPESYQTSLDNDPIPRLPSQPCSELFVTRSRRHLMRQVSALGMGDVTTLRKTGQNKQQLFFDDMSANALPEGMRDMFSICSDPTAEPGQGLDTKHYYSSLGKNAVPPKPTVGRLYRYRESADVFDDTTISTCSLDICYDDNPSSGSHQQELDIQKDLHDQDAISQDSFSLQDVFQENGRRGATEGAGHHNRSSPHDRLGDSHQLLMEAALACRDGTARCSKSLVQAALEQSFSHLSRVSVSRK